MIASSTSGANCNSSTDGARPTQKISGGRGGVAAAVGAVVAIEHLFSEDRDPSETVLMSDWPATPEWRDLDAADTVEGRRRWYLLLDRQRQRQR